MDWDQIECEEMDWDQMEYDEMEYDEMDYNGMDFEDMFHKFWTMASCAMTLMTIYYYKYIYKEPSMTSSLTGEMWIKELINGNPIRCVNAFRMEPDLFVRLCKELSTKYGLRSSSRCQFLRKLASFYTPLL